MLRTPLSRGSTPHLRTLSGPSRPSPPPPLARAQVLFRQLRSSPSSATPVAVQINYHADVAPRMRAVIARYLDGDAEPLKALPLADATGAETSDAPSVSCERSGSPGGFAPLAEQLMAKSPYAWGGVGDISFKAGGVLETPWGQGTWGLHCAGDACAASQDLYADFVGAKHNVHMLPSGMGVSTRCSDNNVVLVRSIKAAKAKAA